MKLSQQIKFPTLSKRKKPTPSTPNYLLWAFLIPFLGMLAVLLLKRCEPLAMCMPFCIPMSIISIIRSSMHSAGHCSAVTPFSSTGMWEWVWIIWG